MEEIFNQIETFILENPQYVYLLIGIIALILFVGTIKNKNWAIDPESGGQRLFYQTFGHNAFRIGTGIVFLCAAIAGFVGFYLYLK